RAGIFASGLGHVGTTAAGTSNFFRDLGDDFARLDFRSEVFGYADDERDFSIAHRSQHHHAGAELVAQVVDQHTKLCAIDIVGTSRQDFYTFHLAHVFAG